MDRIIVNLGERIMFEGDPITMCPAIVRRIDILKSAGKKALEELAL